ncbi:unnamed protein product [Phytophthora fragariaefolia]|uniref:Unnamed protein product n=1 Tax=Phytophthora fragariaefolia TaxID=1490495 RepID=A0A9W6XQB1_9STRA|nr:unnamed protein product [Phytophthora fragariaefolia]
MVAKKPRTTYEAAVASGPRSRQPSGSQPGAGPPAPTSSVTRGIRATSHGAGASHERAAPGEHAPHGCGGLRSGQEEPEKPSYDYEPPTTAGGSRSPSRTVDPARSKPEFGKISTADASQIDATIHKMVYAENQDEYDITRSSLKLQCARIGLTDFCAYFTKNWDSCQPMWVIVSTSVGDKISTKRAVNTSFDIVITEAPLKIQFNHKTRKIGRPQKHRKTTTTRERAARKWFQASQEGRAKAGAKTLLELLQNLDRDKPGLLETQRRLCGVLIKYAEADDQRPVFRKMKNPVLIMDAFYLPPFKLIEHCMKVLPVRNTSQDPVIVDTEVVGITR